MQVEYDALLDASAYRMSRISNSVAGSVLACAQSPSAPMTRQPETLMALVSVTADYPPSHDTLVSCRDAHHCAHPNIGNKESHHATQQSTARTTSAPGTQNASSECWRTKPCLQTACQTPHGVAVSNQSFGAPSTRQPPGYLPRCTDRASTAGDTCTKLWDQPPLNTITARQSHIRTKNTRDCLAAEVAVAAAGRPRTYIPMPPFDGNVSCENSNGRG